MGNRGGLQRRELGLVAGQGEEGGGEGTVKGLDSGGKDGGADNGDVEASGQGCGDADSAVWWEGDGGIDGKGVGVFAGIAARGVVGACGKLLCVLGEALGGEDVEICVGEFLGPGCGDGGAVGGYEGGGYGDGAGGGGVVGEGFVGARGVGGEFGGDLEGRRWGVDARSSAGSS